VKRFTASIGWSFLALVIGLLQLWCLLGYAALDQHSKFIPQRLLLDSGLLFFSTTLVATFSLDFAFSAKTSRNLLLHWLVYFIFPAIIVAWSILVYSVCSVGHPRLLPVLIAQLAVALAAIAYAVVIKFQHFKGRF
jgi:hypothetical protein